MPDFEPSSRAPRMIPAQRLPMSGPGRSGAVEQGFDAVMFQHRGARHFFMKPGRNTRPIARPVWSGPRLNRKVAPALCFFSTSINRGTPSRVPR